MFREDLYEVTLTITGVEGTKLVLICDKMSGGAAKAKDTKYRPANGLAAELSLGGPKSIDNITVSRLYDTTVDPSIEWLITQAGRAEAEVSKQPLDPNGKKKGHSIVYTGRLVDVTPPPTDSESDKAAVIEFMVSPKSEITSVNSA